MNIDTPLSKEERDTIFQVMDGAEDPGFIQECTSVITRIVSDGLKGDGALTYFDLVLSYKEINPDQLKQDSDPGLNPCFFQCISIVKKNIKKILI